MDQTPSDARRPRGRPPAFRWPDLVAGAITVGLADFTVAKVATHLGVRDSTIYNYVDSRDQLLAIAADQVLSGLRLDHDDATSWIDYLIAVDLDLRRLCIAHPGLADYYAHGPYVHHSLQIFDTQIHEVRKRLPGSDDTYAFVVASHASTTTLSYLGSADVDDRSVRRVLEHILPALHTALGGIAPEGLSWATLRANLVAAAVPDPPRDLLPNPPF